MEDYKKQELIKFKERLIYELLISLSIDPASFDEENVELPDINDQKYNLYLVLKNNLEILKKIKDK